MRIKLWPHEAPFSRRSGPYPGRPPRLSDVKLLQIPSDSNKTKAAANDGSLQRLDCADASIRAADRPRLSRRGCLTGARLKKDFVGVWKETHPMFALAAPAKLRASKRLLAPFAK